MRKCTYLPCQGSATTVVDFPSNNGRWYACAAHLGKMVEASKMGAGNDRMAETRPISPEDDEQ